MGILLVFRCWNCHAKRPGRVICRNCGVIVNRNSGEEDD